MSIMATYDCLSGNNNPTGDTPPPDYKLYLCNWKGTPPSSFSGSWYCTNQSALICPTYPDSPVAVTFSRVPCSLSYQAPAPIFPAEAVPFYISIPDPMLPSSASPYDQAVAIGVTGSLPAHPTGTPDAGCTCSASTIFLGYTFTVETCHFRLEITSVAF